jgi:hypothetical protein
MNSFTAVLSAPSATLQVLVESIESPKNDDLAWRRPLGLKHLTLLKHAIYYNTFQ